MKLVELRCKNCGALLKPDNVVERLAMARCDHCDAVFAIEAPAPAGRVEPSPQRGDVPLPKGFTVNDFGNTLEITRRWFSPVFFFLVVFCVFWNGFMVVWHGIALSMGAWFMSLFGLIHTAVGIGLIYATISGLVNRTVFRVGRGTLEVRHEPLPWPGNKTLAANRIEQLYSKEKIRHGKNGVNYAYTVQAVMADGRRETLSGKASRDLPAGSRIRIRTPGAGGYG